MAAIEYDIGDVARLTCTFTVGAVNTDPTTVTCKVEDPAGTKTTYTWAGGTVTRSAAGIFYKDISLTKAGAWYYRFEGTGTVESAEESNIFVNDSEFS